MRSGSKPDSLFFKKVDTFVDSIYNKNTLTIERTNNDYQKWNKQIYEKDSTKNGEDNCSARRLHGYKCIGPIYKEGIQDIDCPCLKKGKFNCNGPANAVTAAKSYIKANKKNSKKDMLKRIERLEEKAEKKKFFSIDLRKILKK